MTTVLYPWPCPIARAASLSLTHAFPSYITQQTSFLKSKSRMDLSLSQSTASSATLFSDDNEDASEAETIACDREDQQNYLRSLIFRQTCDLVCISRYLVWELMLMEWQEFVLRPSKRFIFLNTSAITGFPMIHVLDIDVS